jgi:hypothetical protein
VKGYFPILGLLAVLCIIFITGRNSEAAIGGAGGVLKKQKRQVRAVHGCDRAAKNLCSYIYFVFFLDTTRKNNQTIVKEEPKDQVSSLVYL